ncbi:hypothetical protein ACH40F_43640 [Streptomyces sp. NPDC020794]|uniref:hypothetical protein n=1 Tax=unclassified Streptomyces TaxID=2593676 RepID=UPI0036EE7E0F
MSITLKETQSATITGVPGGREAQQQAGFFLAFLRCRTDVFGRLHHVLLRFLWDGEQFDGLFIVSPQSLKNLHQRPIRPGGEHVLRLLTRLEEYRNDQ